MNNCYNTVTHGLLQPPILLNGNSEVRGSAPQILPVSSTRIGKYRWSSPSRDAHAVVVLIALDHDHRVACCICTCIPVGGITLITKCNVVTSYNPRESQKPFIPSRCLGLSELAWFSGQFLSWDKHIELVGQRWLNTHIPLAHVHARRNDTQKTWNAHDADLSLIWYWNTHWTVNLITERQTFREENS